MNRIKHVLFLGSLIALAGIGVQRAHATDTPSLQDFGIYTDGSWSDIGLGDPVPTGANLGAYSGVGGTGIGTITFTDTNVGSDNFAIWWNEQVGTPYFNEYGSTSGSPVSGESWEIGDNNGSNIYSDASAGDLKGTNYLPLGQDNFYASCIAVNLGDCADLNGISLYNGDATTALGYDFNLLAGQEEVITLTVSTSDSSCSGICLQQTNPNEDIDNSGNAGNVYFSLSAQEESTGPTNPTVTPEPSTWLLMLSGLSILAWRMRGRFALKTLGRFTALLAVGAVALSASARAQQVLTVPWDPTNPASPHTAYAGANIIMGAVFTGSNPAHSYTYSWSFGDGNSTSAAAITNFNDISASHTYAPVSPTPGVTAWTAVVTVNDTTASLQYSGNYLVVWENNVLQSRVNTAIDWGLWYLHQNMYHPTATTGTWAHQCAAGYPGYACGDNEGGLDANNVQAFEVNGHLATGPSIDPYTSDVAEGLADMIVYLSPQTLQSKSYYFNPATANFGCSDGTAPTTFNSGSPHFYCDSSATPVYYNASATSCTAPPCAFNFNASGDNTYFTVSNDYGNWGYEPGMIADALVASGVSTLEASTSLPAPYSGYGTYATYGAYNVGTDTFQTLVQDIVDGAAYSQYGYDYDVSQDYTRGANYQGGGWWYNYQSGDDNSVSQWASIGIIAANRGFGITIPQIVPDANNMWVTASQNVESADVQGTNSGSGGNVDDPGTSGYGNNSFDYGGFGYNGSLYYSDAWGPWAVTPSGMVQMSLDGIGRTRNTGFGDAVTDPDQRFNAAESYYADNFCDPLGDGAYYAPLAYTYGMFSFTKSMLLHNPGGSLTPIQYLRTLTPNVFSGNSSVPANTIDWYAALSSAHGGTDPCDGVAQTLLDRQYAAGYWYGSNANGGQYPFETAWALIMLQKSVFVACVNNLGGAGTPSGTAPARIDLTWTGIPSASGYNVLRGTATGGPYSQVGTTTTDSYSDRVGLANGDTYYYVLQPTNGSGTSLCQSNQAKIAIPAGGRR